MTSVRKGKDAENLIAGRLNAWAQGSYLFRRRGLGHQGVADLVVTHTVGAPPWPFVISIKAAQGPTLPVMLASARAGRVWPWWVEVVDTRATLIDQARACAWLIWRCDRAWMLSCWTLGGLALPPRFSVLPTPAGWPRFTMVLDAFLAAVPVAEVEKAVRDGWGTTDA